MNTGLLAYLDVLGFRDGIVGHNYKNYCSNYLRIIKEILKENKMNEGNDINILVVSDSIVITKIFYDNDPLCCQSSLDFFNLCSEIFYKLTVEDIPLRGSISYGDFERVALKEKKTEKENSVFIAGPALVEAIEVEKKQDWVGIMVAPSLHKQMFYHFTRWSWFPPKHAWDTLFYRYGKIPIKDESNTTEDLDGFVIFPRRTLNNENNMGTQSESDFLEGLNKMKASQIKNSFRQKYQNTINFYKSIANGNVIYHGPLNMYEFEEAKRIIEPLKDYFSHDLIRSWYWGIALFNKSKNDFQDELSKELDRIKDAKLLEAQFNNV
jgi:hypothetical protein